jgi:hypothetical protein
MKNLRQNERFGRSAVQRALVVASPFPDDLDLYWQGGIVPYQFDAAVTADNQNRMLKAMRTWESVAGVRFRPKTEDDDDCIHIHNGTGNSSYVGRQRGAQEVEIASWGVHGVLLHELGHALGFFHTHSRSDRDNFVQIEFGNIQAGQTDQFEVETDALIYGPYDFGSVMHYDRCAFSVSCAAGTSCNCVLETITVLPPFSAQWQTVIGQRVRLSEWDGRLMSFLYPFGDWRFVDQAFTGSPQNGTFLRPFRTFAAGHNAVPSGGTVWIQPGSYPTGGTLSKPMTLHAPLGGVTLTP